MGANDAYDVPDEYGSLDEVAASPPDQNPDKSPLSRRTTLGERNGQRSCSSAIHLQSNKTSPRKKPADDDEDGGYDVPNSYGNLDELEVPSPVEDPDEQGLRLHKSLEEANHEEQDYGRNGSEALTNSQQPHEDPDKGMKKDDGTHRVNRLTTRLYTISYLIFFAILGTLARLGLQAITFYPGAPVVFSIIWPNFAGSLFMGFLSEDRMLFRDEWGTPTYHQQLQKAKQQELDEENEAHFKKEKDRVDMQAAKKKHAAVKKTIPLYIGLATGFCGSLTSFSTFIRDAFLALSNDLPTPLDHPADYIMGSSTSSTVPRNGGQSFMAVTGVIILNIAASIGALYVGAHLAIGTEPIIPSLPFKFCRKVLDRVAVFLAWGCWIGAIFLSIFPPDRNDPGPETWRGRALFAIAFAPLGCLGRFYASQYLNGKIASFPLGTFFVNVAGTAILGMCYDLQHVPLGGEIGCQVLQGIEDGFCGCLTTVSTWVAELTSLRRTHSYRYGGASVIVALCFLIVIMGSMQWTIGFSALQCLH